MQPVNLFADEWDEWPAPQRDGYRKRWLAAGRKLGGELLGASVYELPPGERSFPYHWHAGNEEWLVVLAGTPTVRTPAGEHELGRGDVVCFPRGPAGAHQVSNRSEGAARILMLSTMVTPELVEYPDSGKVGAAGGFGPRRMFKADAQVDYWDGE